ncbi:hypothetical protein V1511DRAFT_521755 [Dipodascopsis uninucleata]
MARFTSSFGGSSSSASRTWQPNSSRGYWSSRIRQNSHNRTNQFLQPPADAGSASSDDDRSSDSENRYLNLSDHDLENAGEKSMEGYKRRKRSALNGADILFARRPVTSRQKIGAILFGVWLVIILVMLFGSPISVEFDPLRSRIQRTKAVVVPTNPNIHYVGRWSRNKAPESVTGLLVSTPFKGMYMDIRFTGTSLAVHLGNIEDPATILVKVDNNDKFEQLPYGRETVSLVNNLPNGEHTARVIFSGAHRIDIEAIYIDKEASLLPYVSKERPQRPLIEVLQDTYNNSLPEVYSWSYLLADRYNIDRSLISEENLCISNCPGDTIGLDKFFFLGSLSASRSMAKYWHFEEYRPSLLIIDVGVATKRLIDKRLMYRTMLPQDASKTYREAFVNLIRQIRKKAYKRVPILILRPFTGELEQESLQVVTTLRDQYGDKNVYWIDTTSWTHSGDTEEIKQIKRAAYLSEHVCPLLRSSFECQFLGPFEGKGVSGAEDA